MKSRSQPKKEKAVKLYKDRESELTAVILDL